jgi:hypothetical protein
MATFSPFSPSRPSRFANPANTFGTSRNAGIVDAPLAAPDALAAYAEFTGHLLTWRHTAPASGGAVRYEVEARVEGAEVGAAHVTLTGAAGTLIHIAPESAPGHRAPVGTSVTYRVRAVQGNRRSTWSAPVVASVNGSTRTRPA